MLVYKEKQMAEEQKVQPQMLLHTYFVEEFNCKANPEFDIKKDISPKGFKVSLEGSQSKDSLHRNVRLFIEQAPDKEGNFPFLFKVVMTALFDVNKEFIEAVGGEEKAAKIVAQNASELLYPAARELLMLISAHGPYVDKRMNIMLPPISFSQFEPTKN